MIAFEPSGASIEDHPTERQLAQDFAASRGWRHPRERAAIFDVEGRHVADNLDELARLMNHAGAFYATPASGATQIMPGFHGLDDDEVRHRFR